MMDEKRCRGKCKKMLLLSEFYKHKGMFDGHLNICRTCTKDRVHKHRKENLEKIREYDRNRPNAKERNEKHCERVKNLSAEKKAQYKATKDKWNCIGFNKNKKTVNMYLLNAIRDKRIEKSDSCEHCGITDVIIQGHHTNYLKPLDVIWLCVPCHNKEHKWLNEEERN